MKTATTWTLTFEDRPWTANKERTLHYHQRARLVAEWRQAFATLARDAHVPPQERIAVTVQPYYRTKGARPDVAACSGAAKASVDGLVDAGVIPDDSPDHLVSLTFLQPVMGAGRDALTLTIEAR